MLGYLRPIGNERGSIIVTSNIAFEHWPGAFVGDAIVIPTLLIVFEQLTPRWRSGEFRR
jgi:hypothetical protein